MEEKWRNRDECRDSKDTKTVRKREREKTMKAIQKMVIFEDSKYKKKDNEKGQETRRSYRK